MASTKFLADLTNLKAELGLQNLAYVASSAVALTGGTIDGVVIGSITTAAGSFTTISTSANAQLASVSIYGGSINATTIGGVTPSVAAFTTLSTTGAATLASLVTASATITGGSLDNVAIGATTPATGAFTSMSATGLTTLGPGISGGLKITNSTSTTRLYDDTNGHIESSNTLWLNGIASGQVNIGAGGGQISLSKAGVATSVLGSLAVTSALSVYSGNSAGAATANQFVLGYNSTATYQHAIKTSHNSNAALGNFISLYTWNYGTDSSTAIGTKLVATFDATLASLATPLTVAGQITSTLTGGGPGAALLVKAGNAGIGLFATGQVADSGLWDFITVGTGLQFRTLSDSGAAQNAWLTVARSTTSATSVSINTALNVSGATTLSGGISGATILKAPTAAPGASAYSLMLNTPGTANSETPDLAFEATFGGTITDHGQRRVADISAGFTGGWNSEYLSLGCGYNGSPNDSGYQTIEQLRLTTGGVTVNRQLTVTGNAVFNGNNIYVTGAASSNRSIFLNTLTTYRWVMQAQSDAETATVTLATSAAQSAAGTVLTFSSTTGVAVGQSVSGTSISSYATVVSFVANTSVTLSVSTSAVVASGASIVFSTNSGSSFALVRFSDVGASLGNSILISRSTGAMYLGGSTTSPVTVSGSLVLPNNSGTSTSRLMLAGTDAAHYIYSSGSNGNTTYLGEYAGNFNFVNTYTGTNVMTITSTTVYAPGYLNVTSGLGVYNGNVSGNTGATQVAFGYNGSQQYQHAIKTSHNSSAASGNSISLWAWNQGTDAVGTIGSKLVATFDATQVTVTVPLTVSSNIVGSTVGCTGSVGSLIVNDRTTSGSGQFYRQNGSNYLWDSTYGVAVVYTSTTTSLLQPTTVANTLAVTNVLTTLTDQTKGPSIDSSTTVSIASGAKYAISMGSGMLLIADNAGGGVAQFFLNNQSTFISSQSTSLFSTSSSATSGNIGVYYDSTTSKYTVINGTSSSYSLGFFTVRVRAAA